MDSNKLRVEAHRAMIASNISGSTQTSDPILEKGEKISITEFKDRLEEGEIFLAEPQIKKFIQDSQENIVKAFTQDDKDSIKKSVDDELNLLKGVTVVNELGKEFQFFSRKETSEDFLEKGKKANIGETRIWNGKKEQKQADGSWKEISEGGKSESSKSDSLKEFTREGGNWGSISDKDVHKHVKNEYSHFSSEKHEAAAKHYDEKAENQKVENKEIFEGFKSRGEKADGNTISHQLKLVEISKLHAEAHRKEAERKKKSS